MCKWQVGYAACSYQPRELILQHFPNIAQQCQQFGLDITRDPIPVAPAQHYMCGGVKVRALRQPMSWTSPAPSHSHVVSLCPLLHCTSAALAADWLPRPGCHKSGCCRFVINHNSALRFACL